MRFTSLHLHRPRHLVALQFGFRVGRYAIACLRIHWTYGGYRRAHVPSLNDNRAVA